MSRLSGGRKIFLICFTFVVHHVFLVSNNFLISNIVLLLNSYFYFSLVLNLKLKSIFFVGCVNITFIIRCFYDSSPKCLLNDL